VHHSNSPGLSKVGEMLYTKAGSQGAAISTYEAFLTGTDPEDWDSKAKSYFYYLNKLDNETYFYKLRPALILNQAPFFTFSPSKPKTATQKYSLLFSLPMFAKYSQLQSVRDIPYERLGIKMKPEFDNINSHRNLLNDVKYNGVDESVRYWVYYRTRNV
jgi:hypothetical protein